MPYTPINDSLFQYVTFAMAYSLLSRSAVDALDHLMYGRFSRVAVADAYELDALGAYHHEVAELLNDYWRK